MEKIKTLFKNILKHKFLSLFLVLVVLLCSGYIAVKNNMPLKYTLSNQLNRILPDVFPVCRNHCGTLACQYSGMEAVYDAYSRLYRCGQAL